MVASMAPNVLEDGSLTTIRGMRRPLLELDGTAVSLAGYDTPSTFTSSPSSSRNSIMDITTDEEDVEEIERIAVLPPSRIDGIHELAMSMWGLVPPRNFGRVLPGIYRSSFPQKENLSFLKTLGLKSILTLVPGDYPKPQTEFVSEEGIRHFRMQILPNKDPFVAFQQSDMDATLAVVLDRANHPLLIHCHKGKHRTGTVIGCLRKCMAWDMERIVAEYRKYAGVKSRPLDEKFINRFDERPLTLLANLSGFSQALEPVIEPPITSLVVSTRLRG